MTKEEISLAQLQNEIILTNIRTMCIQKKTSIPKIEKALGYGNGSVSGWSKAKKRAPSERVEAIAKHLNVSFDYLITDHEYDNSETPVAPEGDGLDAQRAEWSIAWDEATPELRRAALAVLKSAVRPPEGRD